MKFSRAKIYCKFHFSKIKNKKISFHFAPVFFADHLLFSFWLILGIADKYILFPDVDSHSFFYYNLFRLILWTRNQWRKFRAKKFNITHFCSSWTAINLQFSESTKILIAIKIKSELIVKSIMSFWTLGNWKEMRFILRATKFLIFSSHSWHPHTHTSLRNPLYGLWSFFFFFFFLI